ncbi:MAG: caspase family protein, partial [Reyranella sp.]|nr:caspase family protein [Reyranella sp.]
MSVGRRIAFLVGNKDFRSDSNLPALKGPLNDIAALSRVHVDPKRGGFDVRLFPNSSSGEIKAAIEEELGIVGRGDLVLIHYAGHGKLDRVGSLCLATADTRASTLLATSIPARHLRDLAANSDCDAVVLLLDCCYSGAATANLRGDVESQLRSLQDASGFYILSGSSEIQTAGEAEADQSGIVLGRFTAAIVDGIETGSADYDGDGQISLLDIVRYVKSTVKYQTPQFLAARATGDPLIALSPSTITPASATRS